MGNGNSLTNLNVYFILALALGLSNHVFLIPVLLHTALRDAWVAASVALAPLVGFAFLLFLVHKRTGGIKLIKWLNERFGRWAGASVGLAAIVYTLLIALISLEDLVTWTQVSYLPETPRAVIAITFIGLCFFAAKSGIRTIALTSALLLPMVVLLGYFVMGANFQYKNYSLLFPLFTQGYGPVMRAVLYACGGLFELFFILFLQHHLASSMRFVHIALFAVLLTGLTVGPLMGAIAIFGPFEAADLRYPAFEQWRMVTVGKFISHLDFLSIYQWLSGAFIRVSLMLFIVLDTVGFRTKRPRTALLLGLCVILFLLTVYPFSDVMFFRFLADWYFLISFIMTLSLTVLLLGLTLLPGKRREGNPT